ncbi:MAG: hypothetical protein IJT41_01090 [Clostridia bacterium]|nr:hypothetical protein [Clostridia bacterium]
MIENDTVRLLRECDAGVRMGIASIGDVLDNVHAESLRQLLTDSRDEHERLGRTIDEALQRYRDEGKSPPAIAKGMSWIKTNVMLAFDGSDQTVADLMTDGCDMGVKSLSRYLNQYAAADEESKDIAKKLIRIEEQLAVDLRDYL